MKRSVAALTFALFAFAPPAHAAPGPCETLADAIRTGFEADADLSRVFERLSAGPDWKLGDVTLHARAASRPRPVEIGAARFVARFEAPDAQTRLVALRAAGTTKAKPCRVRLTGRAADRIEDMRPADAAAEFARRAPMAALEPALGTLARAVAAGASVDAVGLLGAGAETNGTGGFQFAAGGGRFVATIARAAGETGAVQVALARLVPELANRERPLGTFRYVFGMRMAGVAAE